MKVDYPTGAGPFAIAVKDVNSDTKLDVVVANFKANTVSVLLGNGNGTFQLHSEFGTGREPRSVAISDVNGDSELDFVVANRVSNTISVLLATCLP